MRKLKVAAVVLLVIGTIFAAHTRRVAGGICRNTQQGEMLVTDDRGYVCPVEDIDPVTSCCLRGSGPYTCTGCDTVSQCCILYETCVSCCMKPSFNASERMVSEYKIRGRRETGHFTNEFDFCRSMCRTTKDCTLHENGYRSDFRFCFSETGTYVDETLQVVSCRTIVSFWFVVIVDTR